MLSHPALDWLNTYGVRFLMPFDGAWFYGDALFIIDPWVWLLAATPVVLAHSTSRGKRGRLDRARHRRDVRLITGFRGGPGARAPAVVRRCGPPSWWLRLSGRWERHVPRVAAACAVVLAGYAALMAAASAVAERQVAEHLRARGHAGPIEVMASPAPANPFAAATSWSPMRSTITFSSSTGSPSRRSATVRGIDPAGEAGRGGSRRPLNAPHVRGLSTWMRLPAFHVEETGDGYRVSISDVRYARRPRGRVRRHGRRPRPRAARAPARPATASGPRSSGNTTDRR